MMKKETFLFLILILLMYSCDRDEFLTRTPLAQITETNFPSTPNDLLLATNGVYNTLRIWDFSTGGFPLLNILSDEMTKGSSVGDAIEISSYNNFTMSPTEGSLYRWWSTLYLGIRRANLVIERAEAIKMDQAIKNRYIAECRFLRAYFYSILIRAFGDVPKVLSINPKPSLVRTPRNEIMKDIIIPDLEFAISNLPTKSEYAQSDAGRVTKGTAQSLLARIYLFFKNFSKVEELTSKVIQSGQYSLEPKFSNTYSENFEYGVESIFEIGALPFEDLGQGGNQYANTLAVRGVPNRGWGFGRPSFSFIREFRSDPRMEASIIFLGEVLDGIEIKGSADVKDVTYGENNDTIEIECYNQKIWTKGIDVPSSFKHNKRVIRYADVLLMAAEALNENGKTQEALKYLELVRKRARGNSNSLPKITSTGISVVRNAIYHDRKFELAFEGQRFWDLIRTNRAESTLGKYGFKKGINELLPIPQSEIDLTEGSLTQNPGY